MCPRLPPYSSDQPANIDFENFLPPSTLIPDGRILVAGSNPNADISTTTYRTRFNVEIVTRKHSTRVSVCLALSNVETSFLNRYLAPYVNMARPSIAKVPANLMYGQQYKIKVKLPAGGKVVTVVVMDLGYSTHGVHSSMRNVELVASKVGSNHVVITAPSSPEIYPPGTIVLTTSYRRSLLIYPKRLLLALRSCGWRP